MADDEAFCEMVRPLVERCASEFGLELEAWRGVNPAFQLRYPSHPLAGPGYRFIERCIQVLISRTGENTAAIHVFSVAVRVVRGERRAKTVYVAKGELPRDGERIPSWLGVARATLEAVRDEDLLDTLAWQERVYFSMKPIFNTKNKEATHG